MQKSHTPIISDFNIKKKIGYLKPHSLAKKLGLSTRQYRKCNVVDLLLGHWQLLSLKQFSYDNWATQISSITGKMISGQAICKRMVKETTFFLTELLNKSMQQKYDSILHSELFESFNDVLVQDATHFSLPRFLSQTFPGSYSRYGKSATAKIQATVSLNKGVFRDLKLFSFRDNDQKDSCRVIPLLHKGDLIIRDLGYFVIEAFNQIQSRNAFFLSRFKYNLTIHDLENNELDLLNLLRNKKLIDMDVRIGKKNKMKCRIVAIRLPVEVVQERVRKARKDRNKRTNHSKKYYEHLKYTIFITNVSREIWTPKDIAQAYKARWYIEILFKGWKSNLKLKVDIPEKHMTRQRAEFYLYSSLLFVSLLVMPIFREAQKEIKSTKYTISILKLSAFINQNIQTIINLVKLKTTQMILYYCTYESRRDRLNAIEMIHFVSH